ncbi:MAG: glycosyltransferase, partial [Verrucomicrobiota bacterium]
ELERLPNVHLFGLQPYERMPRYLYHFDVCIIPFKLNEVTRATDPVKFYEYVSSGKPVVSVNLPELEQYRDYLYLAATKEEFALNLDAALQERDPGLVERRKELARQNSWNQRVEAIKDGLTGVTPLASIIIVTFGNLALTRLCIESVLRETGHPHFEVIVVDNASNDGTPSYLSFIAQRDSRIKVILNPKNVGFAAANNQGLALAAGAHLVLLNNDTIVPPGWLTRLLRHLDDPRVGLVGPRTNFAGNEARLETGYTTKRGMEQFAAEHTWANDGREADIAMLAMFCMAMRRDTFKKLGPLDEQFGIGLFEDDDYSQRAKQAGYRVVCAGDVFVHHFGQSAFKELGATGEYARLFAENQRCYEQKWNLIWERHRHAELPYVQRQDQSGGVGQPPLKAQRSHPSDGIPGTGKASENPGYAEKLAKESRKWGSHLQLEARDEWHSWLCHPLVLENYQRRSLVDGLAWPHWVRKAFGGPARRSLDLGCGSGGTSLKLHSMGAAQFVEGIDVCGER